MSVAHYITQRRRDHTQCPPAGSPAPRTPRHPPNSPAFDMENLGLMQSMLPLQMRCISVSYYELWTHRHRLQLYLLVRKEANNNDDEQGSTNDATALGTTTRKKETCCRLRASKSDVPYKRYLNINFSCNSGSCVFLTPHITVCLTLNASTCHP